MHGVGKSDKTISNLECVLIDYFLTSSGKLFMNSLYPNNCLNNSFFQESQNIYDIRNEKKYIMKNKILRDIRENITINSLLDEEYENVQFIKDKLSRTIDIVDKMLLNLNDDEKEIEPNINKPVKKQTIFSKLKSKVRVIFSKIKWKLKKIL